MLYVRLEASLAARGLKVGLNEQGGPDTCTQTRTNACGHTHFNTYRNAFAFDAVHDSEGRAQIREPSGAQFPYLLAKRTFCNKEAFNWYHEFHFTFFFFLYFSAIATGMRMNLTAWKMARLKYLKASRKWRSRLGEGRRRSNGERFRNIYRGLFNVIGESFSRTMAWSNEIPRNDSSTEYTSLIYQISCLTYKLLRERNYFPFSRT